ncbi:MAG: murein biosynthesis integral membrane protein MurJ [Xanthomonadales bacterium]|nr:murein biosynthesis integral membrane protein MurJ [Xanthomonadales bacterium]
MKLLRSTAIVSSMTLFSRVFGFIRDVVIARIFGATAATDAFIVALRIPNLLRRWFAEGSFSLAFVPVLNEYRERGREEELRDLIDATTGALLAVVSLIVGLGMLFAPGFVYLFAFGLTEQPELFDLAQRMLRITFPYALFISLTAMAGGILNTFGRFAVPAFTPVLLNLALIGAALWLAPAFEQPIVALAWGVFIAGVLQLGLQLPALARMGLLRRPVVRFDHPGVRKIGKLMVPTLIGSSVAQLNILVDTQIASFITAGAISWLYYSDRLLEFPLGVFGIAISTVILPSLSRRHAGVDPDGFSRTLDWGLRTGTLIALPAAVGLGVIAAPLVATLFHYGEFGRDDLFMTAASVAAYALGLPGYVMIKVLAPAFYSRQDTRTPVKIAVVALVSNVVLNLTFVAILLRNPIAPPHAGLALASSCSAYLNAGLLYRALRRDGAYEPVAGWGRHWAGIGAACGLMVAFLVWRMPPWAAWADMTLTTRIGNLAWLIGGAMAIYGLVTLATGVLRRELRDAPL